MTVELDAIVERLAAEAAGGEGVEAYAELTTETSVTAFQGEVERLTRLDPPLHHLGDVSDHDGRVAGRFLELRPQLADDDLGHPRAEDFQLG